MTDIAIRVREIGKLYRMGERRGGYKTLRDSLSSLFARNPATASPNAPSHGAANGNRLSAEALAKPGRSAHPSGQETFWALKNVSFDVPRGEIVGIIGRNGAGKSTLLKILSRITDPTEGEVEITGRVGSLLEVGTGFHPELTGRENVFLNGAILGMKRAEIARRFDEIVAFAGTEKFLDTPVKFYSSGMYMRLAFAVAAHLDPEILIVDEVLSVGDAEFQKKCLGKMGDVAHSGRTVLFVSHSMAAVRRLCHRAIWLEAGRVRTDSSANDAVSTYESAMSRGKRCDVRPDRSIAWEARFVDWEIADAADPHKLDHLKPVSLKITIDVHSPIAKAQHGIALYNNEQQLLFGRPLENFGLETGTYVIHYMFPMLPLRPGLYTWAVTLYDDGRLVDSWQCEPEMLVATQSCQAASDEWTGLLNLPSSFAAEGTMRVHSRSQIPQAGVTSR